MNQIPQTRSEKRIVHPPSAGGAEGASPVLSVTLAEGEEVNWLWTHFPDGRSVVTGYEVIKKDGEKAIFNIEDAMADWLQTGEEKAG